jgi:hypothetical protein
LNHDGGHKGGHKGFFEPYKAYRTYKEDIKFFEPYCTYGRTCRYFLNVLLICPICLIWFKKVLKSPFMVLKK